MLSRQEEEQERIETMRQDADWRRQQQEAARAPAQGLTMHGFAQSEANADLGRYGAIGKPTVIGSQPAVKYPQLPSSSPWSGAQPQPGPEPPLSAYDNPALESSAELSAVENQAGSSSVFSSAEPGGAGAPSAPPDVEPAPPSSPVGGPAPVEIFPASGSQGQAGPPSLSANDNTGSNK